MYFSVERVRPLEGYKLLIKFDNGEEGIFDVSPYLNIGKFAELKSLPLFNSVVVKFDTIEWANHLDIDPEVLYEKSLRMKIEPLKEEVTNDSRRNRL
jgi:hypothetical protein